MKKLFLGVALAALPLSAATAQAMNAQAFHQRATALKKKGPFALFARGEIKALMGEAQAAATRAREQRLATIAAKRKPPYCPPQASDKIGSEEFMTRLAAIPAADRGKINMTQAVTRILATKFPCR